ncbi:MAG: twin-arginine translocation signal domain-containing protein, partial [Gammaproteobacteria bacterium]
MIDLYNDYVHGDISRRSFLRRVAAVMGGAAAASTILPLLESNRAWGQQATVDEENLRFKTTEDGQISTFEVRKDDTWKSVPFRTDEQGTSWYVRDSEGVKHPVRMARVPGHANRFEGVYQDVHFGLSFALSGNALEMTATLTNKGETPFNPMTAGMHIGFDSFQPKYPEWNYKLVPKAIRCEPTHHWGHALSPFGQIIGWVCPSPVASYTIDYANGYGLKGIYTANIDFINQLPLPARHPQNLTGLKPGETTSWTVYLMEIGSLDEVKSELASRGDVPIFDAEYYTVAPGQETRVTVFGPKVKTLTATNSDGKEITISPAKTGNGRTDYLFKQDEPELYTFRAECIN